MDIGKNVAGGTAKQQHQHRQQYTSMQAVAALLFCGHHRYVDHQYRPENRPGAEHSPHKAMHGVPAAFPGENHQQQQKQSEHKENNGVALVPAIPVAFAAVLYWARGSGCFDCGCGFDFGSGFCCRRFFCFLWNRTAFSPPVFWRLLFFWSVPSDPLLSFGKTERMIPQMRSVPNLTCFFSSFRISLLFRRPFQSCHTGLPARRTENPENRSGRTPRRLPLPARFPRPAPVPGYSWKAG